MTNIELLSRLGIMTGETDDDLLLTYLDIAGERVCRKAFPFNPDMTEVPVQYQGVQLEIAAYLINKMGAEGETIHIENGTDRHYASASIPDDMLKTVVARVGVPR